MSLRKRFVNVNGFVYNNFNNVEIQSRVIIAHWVILQNFDWMWSRNEVSLFVS